MGLKLCMKGISFHIKHINFEILQWFFGTFEKRAPGLCNDRNETCITFCYRMFKELRRADWLVRVHYYYVYMFREFEPTDLRNKILHFLYFHM